MVDINDYDDDYDDDGDDDYDDDDDDYDYDDDDNNNNPNHNPINNDELKLILHQQTIRIKANRVNRIAHVNCILGECDYSRKPILLRERSLCKISVSNVICVLFVNYKFVMFDSFLCFRRLLNVFTIGFGFITLESVVLLCGLINCTQNTHIKTDLPGMWFP